MEQTVCQINSEPLGGVDSIKKYTEQQHAKRLIKMLEKVNNPCRFGCPAGKNFRVRSTFIRDYDEGHVCTVCWGFLDKGEEFDIMYPDCPCDNYENETIKMTWVALERKGYLDT